MHFKLDPQRMDGTLEVHEPASGPLENILSVPGLGALSANLKIGGPRDAEQIDLALNAGDLAARAHGTVDLRKVSADLSYSLEAPAVSPRPDLRWQRVALEGRWRGAFTDPDAEGHLEVEKLLLPGGTADRGAARGSRRGRRRHHAQGTDRWAAHPGSRAVAARKGSAQDRRRLAREGGRSGRSA